MKKVLTTLMPLLLMLMLSVAPLSGSAQCTLCKSNVESARSEEEGYDISGLNKGILYMMAAPYVLGGIIGFFWYRNVRQKRRQASA